MDQYYARGTLRDRIDLLSREGHGELDDEVVREVDELPPSVMITCWECGAYHVGGDDYDHPQAYERARSRFLELHPSCHHHALEMLMYEVMES